MTIKLKPKVPRFKLDLYRIINKAIEDAVPYAVKQYLNYKDVNKVELLEDGINDEFNDKLVEAFWLKLDDAGLALSDED